MPYTAQKVYDEVCRLLLENSGLSLAYTEASFLRDLQLSLDELCQETGFANKFLCQPLFFRQTDYDLPSVAMDVHEVMVNCRHIQETSSFYLDRGDPLSDLDEGNPEQWHRDKIGVGKVKISPPPRSSGAQIGTDPVVGLFGTPGGTISPTVIDIESSESLYGTISKAEGDYYVEVSGPMYGIIGSMTVADKNIALLSTVKPVTTDLSLDSYLELVPDSFACYLKWFVLERIWSTDGESKDIARATYAGTRKQEVIGLAKAIMDEDLPAK
jgi:hypothetical protein